jgi:molybdate transport system substrate-binding protein
MSKFSILRAISVVALSFAFALGAPPIQGVANGAEVQVLASVALTSVLDKLGPAFERSSGNKVSVGYGLTADLRKRILNGEAVDVVILGAQALDDLQKQGKLMPGSATGVAGTPVSVVIRAGAPKPDSRSIQAHASVRQVNCLR